jgi:UDP:flavonoid glycosyltransferase YjiC (YdhE family)
MRIILTTFGSLGDLHPYLAISSALKDRGHQPVIATSLFYKDKVEKAGIGFHAIRPDFPDAKTAAALMVRVMDHRKGSEVVVRELVMPHLRDSYDDLLEAVRGADLLVSHVITYAARLVAEKTGIPWASTILAPMCFLSAYDPPVLPPAPWLTKLRFLGPWFHRPLHGVLKWSIRSWSEPWHRLRAELGLPPTKENPMFEGQHSPRLVLALFSRLLAEKQPDWPAQTVVTGFPFYDERNSNGLPPALAAFLEKGPPPIVFTLGSSAVMSPGLFWETSVAVAEKLKQRAVLLVGSEPGNCPANLPDSVMAVDYVPHAALFPRASVIVHQGGVGTTAQAMKSGRPMLVMPFSHDQPDNANCVVRLGIARTISPKQYTVERAAVEIRLLLENPSYGKRASQVGQEIQRENGVENICNALESLSGVGVTSPGSKSL